VKKKYTVEPVPGVPLELSWSPPEE
jgi:hypothetical protein